MEHIIIGQIGITIQNEAGWNEDYYRIDGDWQGVPETAELIQRNMEDPARFVINKEDDNVSVYTGQPEAAVQLAAYLNRQRGVDISESEAAAAQEQLIRMQEGDEIEQLRFEP